MYDYHATCIRVIGPLTLHCDLDLGFNVHFRTPIRLDALAQPSRERRAETLAFVNKWLQKHPTFTMRSLYSQEKYGRWLGSIKGDDGSILNSELVSAGLVEHIDPAKIPVDEIL